MSRVDVPPEITEEMYISVVRENQEFKKRLAATEKAVRYLGFMIDNDYFDGTIDFLNDAVDKGIEVDFNEG